MLIKIAAGIATVAVITTREAKIRNLKKDCKTLATYASAKDEQTAYLTRVLEYFAHKIDDNDVEIDEFDMIALENL